MDAKTAGGDPRERVIEFVEGEWVDATGTGQPAATVWCVHAAPPSRGVDRWAWSALGATGEASSIHDAMAAAEAALWRRVDELDAGAKAKPDKKSPRPRLLAPDGVSLRICVSIDEATASLLRDVMATGGAQSHLMRSLVEHHARRVDHAMRVLRGLGCSGAWALAQVEGPLDVVGAAMGSEIAMADLPRVHALAGALAVFREAIAAGDTRVRPMLLAADRRQPDDDATA
jgi:hypothetical protein